jgi:hypothetical protein
VPLVRVGYEPFGVNDRVNPIASRGPSTVGRTTTGPFQPLETLAKPVRMDCEVDAFGIREHDLQNQAAAEDRARHSMSSRHRDAVDGTVARVRWAACRSSMMD